MITHVAILLDNGLLLSMPKPARHHNIIEKYCEGHEGSIPSHKQGFLANFETDFIDRKAAFIIAKRSGQLKPPGRPGTLFSEDVW